VASPTDITELIGRLGADDASVRRIAARDLARAGDAGLRAICERLAIEPDEKTSLLMVRLVSRFAGARAVLERLRDDPASPVRVYHACLIAVDAMA